MPYYSTSKIHDVQRVKALALARGSLGLIDARGLTAGQMHALRVAARGRSVNVVVVKNTLARLAWDGTPMQVALGLLTGPVAHLYGDGVACAQIAAECAKACPKASLVGGVFEGAPLGPDGLRAVAALPPRPELLGRLCLALQERAKALEAGPSME